MTGAVRNDIQGLRALGAILVAVFHIWEFGISGGVDVFFVVSGYFLGISHVRRLEQGRTLTATEHFGGFITRTVPEIVLVLCCILIAGLFLVGGIYWKPLLEDVFYSALYVENYALISRGQDYLAREEPASLAQHFWAVALIGQAYFVWYPLVRISGSMSALSGRFEARSILWVMLGALTTLSLCWSVYWTMREPTAAYFDLLTRYWQFGIGALLGLWRPAYTRLSFSRPMLDGLSWIGLGLLLTCGIILGTSASFPGVASLWPVTAAAIILVASREDTPSNAGYYIALRPLSGLGRYAFGIYLWHWPIYMMTLLLTDTDPSLIAGIAIILASVLLAMLSKAFAETVNGASLQLIGFRAFTVACLSMLAIVASISFGALRLVETPRFSAFVGELSMLAGPHGQLSPGPLEVRADLPRSYADGCHQDRRSADVLRCEYGPPEADETVFLVGGSHSAHWLPALLRVAEDRSWRIVSATKSACIFAAPEDAAVFEQENRHASCAEWNRNLLAILLEERPDMVVTLATRPVFVRPEERANSPVRAENVPDGYVSRFQSLIAAGIDVVALRDTPWMSHDVPSCVFRHRFTDAASCGRLRQDVLFDESLAEQLERIPRGVYLVDMNDRICDQTTCPAVRDGMLIYRDRHHLTATYARHLGPVLADRIETARARSPGSDR